MKSFRYWTAVVGCSLVLCASVARPGLAQGEPAAEQPAPATAPAQGAAESQGADAPRSPLTAEQPAAAEDGSAGASPSQQPVAEPPATPEAEGAAGAKADEAAAEEAGADETARRPGAGLSSWVLAFIAIMVVAVPILVGNALAKKLRMPDYGWKLALGLTTITAASVICYFGWPPHLGPDLSGGVNLIYEVDPKVKDVPTEKLIGAIAQRINPGGVKEIMIRPYGQRQIEIIIPRADPAQVRLVKKKISTAGALEFRIVANPLDHAAEIAAARETEKHDVKIGGRVVARWVNLDTTEFGPDRIAQMITRKTPAGDTEVLVVMDQYNVTGEYLESASSMIGSNGRPAVSFTFDSAGARRFAALTDENAPNAATGQKRDLGIVLDDKLLSAPSLNSAITGGRGEITSDFFTKEEVDFLISILNAGSLPAALNKTPISERVTSATLGADTVRTSAYAMVGSIIAVMLFMWGYYRFCGFVACLALFINLVLLLAVMILIKAAFTLPGIAGLVLTVGMAVDANVLIYERFREEIARGTSLRMAIRNGFDRATVTIVDANVTTLLTAIVLYWIGTDQVRGFAVTLIIGILISMYTVIFLGRILFEIAERKRWITKLGMMQLVRNPRVDFVGKRRLAVGFSLALMVLGLGAVAARGKTLLDIDFTGGSSVTVKFDESQQIGDVRAEVAAATEELADKVRAAEQTVDATPEAERKNLDERTRDLADIVLPVDYTVVGVGQGNQLYKIDTSIKDFKIAQQMLKEHFGQRLETNSLKHTPLESVASEGEAAGPRFTTALAFGEPIKYQSLTGLLTKEVFGAGGLPEEIPFTISNPQHQEGSEVARDEWNLTLATDRATAEKTLAALTREINAMTVFPAASNIGSQVAGDTQVQAGYALLASLVAMVAYLWIRFQQVGFGLAAVAALVHDVIITVGALAVSSYVVIYVYPVAAGLLLDPFKIGLTVVAALLTVVGYSVNDTIVVFDRIREVRGKSPDLTPDMINASINQTLSRTLLTSWTTLMVVIILYIWGGPGIHAFAFSLLVGITIGTYSSIFIASPILLWINKPAAAKSDRPTTEAAQA